MEGESEEDRAGNMETGQECDTDAAERKEGRKSRGETVSGGSLAGRHQRASCAGDQQPHRRR